MRYTNQLRYNRLFFAIGGVWLLHQTGWDQPAAASAADAEPRHTRGTARSKQWSMV